MFEIERILAVGETAEWGECIAFCTTEASWFNLTVPFTSRVLRINQALQDFNKNGKFSQMDWVVEVQKIDSAENENHHYHQYRSEPLKNTWHKTTTSHLDIEIGFELRNNGTQEMYFKNFRLLGTSFKQNEPMCSFDYCPKYLSLAYLNQEALIEELEKHKKLAYLYAPCDISKVDLPFEMYEAIFRPNDWLLWHCKRESMLHIKRTFHAYKDDSYCLWYQTEGEYIRIGLYTKEYEYIEKHGYMPCQFPSVGKILYKDEMLLFFEVNGPYCPEAYTPFEMEIISQNPKNEIYEAIAKNGDTKDFFGANSFGKENFFEESWLFMVRPLYPEKAQVYLDTLFSEGNFI
jgi:hypothetical protein